MDNKRPYIFGKLEPCYEANPTLWNVFCALTNRPVAQPNYNWTEHDVITYLLSRGINDIRRTEDNNDQPVTVRDGLGYNIRRDKETGNCMAVRNVSNSEDSCLFIIGS